MPISDPANKPYASELIARYRPRTVLDIGPGVGTYGSIIRENLKVERLDAVEIWGPYIEKYRLNEIYDNVFVCDVRYWRDFGYDLVILGDVLEHLTLEEAALLWETMSSQAGGALISIPIVYYPQGYIEGNPFETHQVTDWTTEKVLKHFNSIVEYNEFHVTGVFLAVFADSGIAESVAHLTKPDPIIGVPERAVGKPLSGEWRSRETIRLGSDDAFAAGICPEVQ